MGRSTNNEPTADSVDDRIIEFILENNLRAGDALPSVRELAKKWNAGFTAIRDALQRARAFGLVEIQPRARVVVNATSYEPTLLMLGRTLQVTLGRQDPRLAHLWDAREMIEIETVSKAAVRRLPEDLVELRQLLEEMRRVQGDREKFVLVDEKFHLTIGRIAGNPVLLVMLEVLLKLLRPDRLVKKPSPKSAPPIMAGHEAIYSAILDGDAESAGKLVSQHYRRHVRSLLEYKDGNHKPARTAT